MPLLSHLLIALAAAIGGYILGSVNPHTSHENMEMSRDIVEDINMSDMSGEEAADEMSMNMENMENMVMVDGIMMHPAREIDPELPVPRVSFAAFLDTMDGYNIRIETENFRFAPEDVNAAPVANEGHAHIYVNGKKVSRLYGPWFNLRSQYLDEGTNEVLITLNANDHTGWALDGQCISHLELLAR